MFLMGDSHCMSAAWRHVTLRGERRVLQPLLVTGLKAWHLRPESKFYPKTGFENTVAALPKRAQVVVLFGEIDCREGLLVSVERCRYETVEEGAQVTIDIYVVRRCRLTSG